MGQKAGTSPRQMAQVNLFQRMYDQYRNQPHRCHGETRHT